MRNKITSIIQRLLKSEKKDIRSRLIRLVLVGGVCTFVILSLISLLSIMITWQIMNLRGEDLRNSTSEYVENFSKLQSLAHIKRFTRTKAIQMEQMFESSVGDVSTIVETMNLIMTNPQNYSPKILPSTRDRAIRIAEPFIHYSSSLKEISDEVRRDIQLESNIKNTLFEVSQYYDESDATLYVASKNDYMIMVDIEHGEKFVPLNDNFMNNFIVTQRTWYKKAETEDKLIFTDLYSSSDGHYSLTIAKPYYQSGNFAGVVGIGLAVDSLNEMVIDTVSNETDINFVVNNQGEIIMSSDEKGFFSPGTMEFKNQFNEIAEKMIAGESGVNEIKIGKKEYFIAYAPINITNWSFVSLIAKESIMTPVQEAKYNIVSQMNDFKENLGQIFLILIAISTVILILLLIALFKFGIKHSNLFVKPILDLSNEVREIASGNFDKKIEIQTGDEIESLAQCFNSMTSELKNYMKNLTKQTAEKERIATELNVARDIQQSMLPKNFKCGEGKYNICASMNAAKSVGGDFYDFYSLDENHLMITIADVSGKGVPAALFMARSKTILKNLALLMNDPDNLSEIMNKANQQLCQDNEEMMFVTVFIAMIDLNSGKIIYVNGGHNPPMIYHEGQFEYLKMNENCVLGMMDEINFVQQEINLSEGDIIYLYTDGVTEAMDVDNNQYGEEKLSNCLNGLSNKNIPLNEILQEVKKDLSKHVKEAEQSDDITMLAVRLNLK